MLLKNHQRLRRCGRGVREHGLAWAGAGHSCWAVFSLSTRDFYEYMILAWEDGVGTVIE